MPPVMTEKLCVLGEVGASACAWLLEPPVCGRERPGKGRRCVPVQEAECHLCNLKTIQTA